MADTGPVGIEARGSKQTEDKQRNVLQHFHDITLAFLRGRTEATTALLGKYLNAAVVQDAARTAGINMKSPIAAFLRVVPESFVIVHA